MTSVTPRVPPQESLHPVRPKGPTKPEMTMMELLEVLAQILPADRPSVVFRREDIYD